MVCGSPSVDVDLLKVGAGGLGVLLILLTPSPDTLPHSPLHPSRRSLFLCMCLHTRHPPCCMHCHRALTVSCVLAISVAVCNLQKCTRYDGISESEELTQRFWRVRTPPLSSLSRALAVCCTCFAWSHRARVSCFAVFCVACVFQILRSMSEQEKRMFLKFVWGRSRLPLTEAQFTQQFRLTRLSHSYVPRLPSAAGAAPF